MKTGQISWPEVDQIESIDSQVTKLLHSEVHTEPGSVGADIQVLDTRSNLDFTDRLWLILKGNDPTLWFFDWKGYLGIVTGCLAAQICMMFTFFFSYQKLP